jgi:uroporphyrinogen III methyltransferase/synthase
VSGARVLLPRALVAREALPDALRQAGVQVDVVPVYRTLPAGEERRAELTGALRAGTIDIVMLTSASMVDALCDLLGEAAPGLLAGVRLASIGPITTEAAQRRGLSVSVTAAKSTVEALVATLETAL